MADYNLTHTGAQIDAAIDDVGKKVGVVVSTIAELNAAFAAGKKHIMFAEGVDLTLSSGLTIPAGTVIFGNGAKFTRATGFENYLIGVGAGCEVSNITIDGNRSNMINPTWGETVDMYLYGFCNIHDVTFVNANEALMASGDSNRITHCKFTNCGGNAIHFTGGKYTVVDGCYVKGTNKRSGMGHENGCIIWSSECGYVTCVNNYCEDGISGFGRIGSYPSGFAKIIGNTVKDCTKSCIISNGSVGTRNGQEIIIANNLFVNSGAVELSKTNSDATDNGKVSIVNNTFIETKITGSKYANVVISGNNMRGDSVCIHLTLCSNITVSNNVVNNTGTLVMTVLAYICKGGVISGNCIAGTNDVLQLSGSVGIVCSGNKVSARCPSTNDSAVGYSSGCVLANNVVISYGKGFYADSGCHIIGNEFWLANDAVAIGTWGGTQKAMVALNITNKTNSLNGDSSCQFLGNIENSTVDMFVTATLTLTNITSNGFSKAVLGDDYICVLTAASGYSLPDTITVSANGVTLNTEEYEYNKNTGKVIVYGVLGAVVITASGIAA